MSKLILVRIVSLEKGIEVSLANIKYRAIAPFVGLEPDRNMKDIDIFHLHRSQIPTALFKSIVQDIDIMLLQYGPPIEHETEEASSRFLSSVSATPIGVNKFNMYVPFIHFWTPRSIVIWCSCR